ncbi:MAG: DNA polymerase I [Dehalococcoidia bacterium]|nr:DNA polymerase I [Dehalococcoidia bacterium]
MSARSPLIILIDGNAMVHRAYHAFAAASGRAAIALTTKSGEPVTAVFGFANMLLKVLADHQPAYIACAFDTHAPTFRDELYDAYKAGRAKTPDDLIPQFERVKELLRAFNVPIYELDGFEADDVLGALSLQATQQGIETIIVTGDADAMQLVGPHVRVLYPGSRTLTDATLYDETKVEERYGVPPVRVPDWKGLKGDPSDNIPGVPGVGDKTATKLLQQFGSMEGIYEHLTEVLPPRVQELLRVNEELARKSKHLATIVRDVPVSLDPEACVVQSFDRARVVRLLRELEFNSLLARLPQQDAAPAIGGQLSLMGDTGPAFVGTGKVSPEGNYITVDTPEGLDAVVRRLSEAPVVVVDVETTSLRPTEARLVGLALSPGPGEAFYIPLAHQVGPNLDLGLVQRRLGPLLADPAKPKAAHNGNFDLIVLAEHGLPVENLASDTIIAAYLLGEKALGLKNLAFNKLGIEMTQISELIGTGSKQLTMDQVPAAKAASYACADADMTARLRETFEEALRRQGLWDLYTKVEMPLVPVLVQMERWGVALDVNLLGQMSREFREKLGELEVAIYNDAGHQFNINSTQQLGQVLFEQLGLPKGRRTSKGYSTDQSVLESLRGGHPIIAHILEYRQLSKLKSTYIDALPMLVNPRTHRVHTSFNQTGAATGRVSSNDPNLQNIPIRTELGKKVRTAFIPEGNAVLMSADYSQVELRVLAHLSQDPGLIEAFLAGEDIHNTTASTVFGVAPNELNSEHRRVAKVVNFGIVYGLSAFGLMRAIPGMMRDDAAKFIETYFAKYPGVRAYIDRTLREGVERGYVETLLGRRRWMPELTHANGQIRSAAERVAINMPVQGTAADVIKVAMINLHRVFQEKGYRTKMILQVHDELLFEVPPDELEEMRRLVPEYMANAVPLVVPLDVDVGVGANWGALLEVQEDAEELELIGAEA